MLQWFKGCTWLERIEGSEELERSKKDKRFTRVREKLEGLERD